MHSLLYLLKLAFVVLFWSMPWLFVAYYIITHAIYAWYFKSAKVDKWWLSLIPCGRMLLYRKFVKVNWFLIVMYVLTGLSMYIGAEEIIGKTYTVYMGLGELLFPFALIIVEYLYARVFYKKQRFLFALFPPYKFYLLLKEIKRMRAISSSSEEVANEEIS